MGNRITHSGIVEEAQGNVLRVRIVQTSACAACKVSAHCHAAEQKEKVVDVSRPAHLQLRVGDTVTVVASAQTGLKAVVLAFVVPFVLMVGAVFVCSRLTADEAVMAMAGLLALIPYYICLYAMRNRIRQQMAFSVEK